MGKQIKALLYFFITDIRYHYMVFWAIFSAILIVSLVFATFLLTVDDGRIGFAIPIATYSYCLYLGFRTARDNLFYSIELGATRKNIFASVGVFFISFAIFMSLVANTLQSILVQVVHWINLDSFHFIHPATALEDTWLTRTTIDIAIFFFLSIFMFVMVLLFDKFGISGGGAIVGVLAIVLLISIAKGWIFDLIGNLFTSSNYLLVSFVFIGVGLLLYGLSFLLLRTLTIHRSSH